MAFKILTVVSESTGRNPVPLGEKVQEAVSQFLASPDGGVLDKLDIVPNYTHGHFGQALVTVYFNQKQAEPKSSKSSKGGK